jgi:hypothetical protein
MQVQATALKKQLLQQLGVKPEQTQQLISRQPDAINYSADTLVRKATEQGQLLDVEAAYVVVQLWTSSLTLPKASTEQLHAKLAQLWLLLQPYMSPADVRQLVLSEPDLALSSPETVRLRLEALQECLPDWSPQHLGAALLPYANVLMRSPDTIRYNGRIASQYSDMYTLGLQKQQQEQQQGQPHRASVLGLFQCPAERYALLENILQQQQQSQSSFSSAGSSVNISTQGSKSSSDGVAHSIHVPPMLKVLRGGKQPFEPCCRSTTEASGSGTSSGSWQ